MSQYQATIDWRRDGADFSKGRYSRAHRWTLDCGTVLAASASPSVVPLPYSEEKAIDPEEAFVASISSCHMLWFLDIARQAGFVVDSYSDTARGVMTTQDGGGLWVSRVDLYPVTAWGGEPPDRSALEALHHKAHEMCFIANSVQTEIVTHLQPA